MNEKAAKNNFHSDGKKVRPQKTVVPLIPFENWKVSFLFAQHISVTQVVMGVTYMGSLTLSSTKWPFLMGEVEKNEQFMKFTEMWKRGWKWGVSIRPLICAQTEAEIEQCPCNNQTWVKGELKGVHKEGCFPLTLCPAGLIIRVFAPEIMTPHKAKCL